MFKYIYANYEPGIAFSLYFMN